MWLSFEERKKARAPPATTAKPLRGDDGARVARSPELSAQLRSHLFEYAAKHLWRQHPRIGVVARAVIAVVKFGGAGLMHCAMGKRRRGGPQAQRLQRRFMGHPAERHDRAQVWHGLDGRDQKLPTAVDFRTQRTALLMRQSTSVSPSSGRA